MKPALIIPIFNRPQYLKQCFDSLKEADWPNDILIILINDASTDPDTFRLFSEFVIPGVDILRHTNPVNKGIKFNIQYGVEKAISFGCDIFINLDSDAIVKTNFISRLLEFKRTHFSCLVTGFNSINKNRDGSERHKVLLETPEFIEKQSFGGINFCFNESDYGWYILPALRESGNWDHKACIIARSQARSILCLKPSVVQHIGFDSSMNHNEEPDVACDFYNLALPRVTLFGADTSKFHLLKKAADISQKDIMFGQVKILTAPDVNFRSKEDYNLFMVKKLNEYIETEFVINIQWDGYILNYKGWSDDFYNYDFIGATWLYHDGMNVGNGGFSMRSKKLLEVLANDPEITQTMPEDHQICRTYRRYLENTHGIRFAPAEVADRFSIEAYGASILPGANKYSGQFGFHGENVDYSGCSLPHVPTFERPTYPRQTNMRGTALGGRTR